MKQNANLLTAMPITSGAATAATAVTAAMAAMASATAVDKNVSRQPFVQTATKW